MPESDYYLVGTLINVTALAAGAFLMLLAVALTQTSIATNNYRQEVLMEIGCAALAVCCLFVPFKRGATGWRVAAIVIALPAVLVCCDFLGRMNVLFH